MNTPKPCDTCYHMYYDVMTEDDPGSESECIHDPPAEMGNMMCPYYKRHPRLDDDNSSR